MHVYMKKVRFVIIAMVSLLAASNTEAKTLDTLVVQGLLNPEQTSVVKRRVGLKEGESFEAAQLQEAIKKLYSLGLYRQIEFLVSDETDSSVSLVLRVEEFPVMEKVEIEGNKKIRNDEIEKALTVAEGRTLSDVKIHENKRAIKDLYAEKGFLRAEVEVDTIPTKVPGNVIAKFKIKEGPKVRVAQITFKGNDAIDEAKLKRKFKTKERRFLFGGDFDKELYESHLDSLVLFYNSEGYLDAEVVDDSLWYAENGRDLFIQVEVNEGNQFYRGDFFFSGNKVLEDEQLDAQVALKRGKPFDKDKFLLTMDAVANRYREEGFLWIQVNDRRRFRGDTIDVTFEVSEGVPAVVRKIDIVGNDKTREKVIRREIRLMPGQKYKQSAMMRSVRDIHQLAYFDNVVPDLKPNEDGTVDFVFRVAEKENIGQLSLGAAYSQDAGLVGTFQTSIPNFRGAGQKLDLNLELGKDSRRVAVGFTEPYAFDTPTFLSGNVFYTYRRYDRTGMLTLKNSMGEDSITVPVPDDEIESYGFSGTVGRDLKWPDDYFDIRATYQISKERNTTAFSDSSSSKLTILPSGVLSKLSLTLRRNDFDLPLFPTRGSNFYISPEIAGLGGDYRYLKTTVGFDNYFPLPWKFVLGTRTKFGMINALGSNKIAIQELDLFSGGGEFYMDAVVRGYDAYSFGGRSLLGNRTNYEKGLNMLSLTAELRYPVVDQTLYLALFGDMGNTYSDISDIDLKEMYKGVGVGVRLMIPMLGLLGLDLGYGLDNPATRNSHFDDGAMKNAKFHFIMNRGF